MLAVAARGNQEVDEGNPEGVEGITGRRASEGLEQLFKGSWRYSQEGETPKGGNGRRGQGRWPAVGNRRCSRRLKERQENS